MAPRADQTPVGTRRDRYIAILVGVVVGYMAGLSLEDRYGWQDARIVAMLVGGVLAGIVARFTVPRFRDTEPPNRRSR